MPEISEEEHRRATRAAYDKLAAVWSETTDDGPYNGLLERPGLRSLVPRPLDGKRVLEAGCGSGAQCEWLADQGAIVTGFDASPEMVKHAAQRCGDRAHIFVADFQDELGLPPESFDGVTCSLALHYARDWTVPLGSFAQLLRPGGWVVLSLEHPLGIIPSQKGTYFDTELITDTWEKAGIEVEQKFWRRPLGAAVNAFADAGFVVERIAEPTPAPEALARFPELELTAREPFFIVYRLRKC